MKSLQSVVIYTLRTRPFAALCPWMFCVGFAPVGKAQEKPVIEPFAVATHGHQEMVPSDFLDCVGLETKARWRQLYRESPPPPSSDRFRVSYALGGLIADSYLALQAGDVQQFKNVNQDIIKYCGALGLAEKVKPRMLAESKMAETEDWEGVRKQVAASQATVEKLLADQRDDDLSLLVNLGMWLRMFEISSTLVHNDKDLQNKTLCIGSGPLLVALLARFERISETTRKADAVPFIGNVLDQLRKHWDNRGNGESDEDIVQMTFEKLQFLNGKMGVK